MTGERLTDRTELQRLLLAAILFVAGYLRLYGIGRPSFWLDEILGYDIASSAAKAPLWRWAWPFEAEHGPLYHATELAGRFLSQPEASARIWPAIFGIATVAVLWWAGRAISEPVAVAAAVLMALSPMGVYYSREGRPYALLMLLAALTLGFLLRGSRMAIVPLILMLFTSAVAVPFLMSVVLLPLDRRLQPAVPRTSVRGPAIAALLCTLAAFAMYHPSTAQISPFRFPSLTTFPWLFAIVAILGAVTFRRWTVVTLATLPPILTIAALMIRNHWFAERYLTPALPAFLLLVACGVAAMCRNTWLAIAVSILLAIPGMPRALREPYEKVDWRGTADLLRRDAHEWDLVILTNDWTDHCLGFYLRERPITVNWINVKESVTKADALMRNSHRAWIVVDGFYSDDRIVGWANQYRKVSEVLRFSVGNSRSSPAR